LGRFQDEKRLKRGNSGYGTFDVPKETITALKNAIKGEQPKSKP
jgi:hypothetical protein